MIKSTVKKGVMITVVAIVVWLVGSTVLYAVAPNLIFHPDKSHKGKPTDIVPKEYTIKNNKSQNLSLWEFGNIRSDEYILYFHGNGGRNFNFFSELTKKSTVISPAYPGYAESEGSPTVENSYETGELAYKWLLEKVIPENKITIFGHSLGGSMAVRVAANHPKARRLIILNSFSSVQSMCFKDYLILCAFGGGLFNSAEDAKKVTIPSRIFGLIGDETVPFEESKKLYEYFTSTSDKKFITTTVGSHNFPDWEMILAELES